MSPCECVVGDDHRAALAACYARIDGAGRAALASGTLVVDPPSRDGDARWGVSATLRVSPWTPALATCARELAELLGPGHAVYGPQAAHLTLRQFENFRQPVPANDAAVAAYAAALADVIAGEPPFRVTLRGLAPTPAGVVVLGWPDRDLQPLRRALHERLASVGLAARGPESEVARLRDTAHVSLAVYGRRPEHPAAVAAFVERHRATVFGEYTIETARVVGYRRTRDAVVLVEYASMPCGTRGAP